MGWIEIYVAKNFQAFLFKGDLLSITYIHTLCENVNISIHFFVERVPANGTSLFGLKLCRSGFFLLLYTDCEVDINIKKYIIAS